MSKQLIEMLPVLVPVFCCTLSFAAGAILAGIIWYRRGYQKRSKEVFIEGRNNQKRKFGSATFYWFLKDGERKYLFTHDALVDAQFRANDNPEDCK